MKFNCGGHELELFCHTEDGEIVIDQIEGDTEAALRDIMMVYMQTKLIEAYKFAAAEEQLGYDLERRGE